MISDLPLWINLTFLLIVFATIILFYFANGKSKKILMLIFSWSIFHAALAWSGFYQSTSLPPRFGLILIPLILIFIYALRPSQIQWIHKKRNLQLSTFLHTVRLPVEITLYYLFLNKMVPELMTFEGRNFDILIGISAPIITLLFYYNKFPNKLLLTWNMIGLFLVSFIFVNGLLSAELPFQQFGFDQPNKAVAYFPFVLLPATVVPLAMYSHITDILLLVKQGR